MRPSKASRRLILLLLAAGAMLAAPASASAALSTSPSGQIDFGSVPYEGQGKDTGVTVTNNGRLPVTIRSVSTGYPADAYPRRPVAHGDWFTYSPGSCAPGTKLAAGDSCKLTVGFHPKGRDVAESYLHVAAADLLGDASAPSVYLRGYGSYIGTTCSDSDISPTRDPHNPLALPSNDHPPTATNPLQGVVPHLFVDRTDGLAYSPTNYVSRYPQLHKIADQAENKRWSRFTGNGSAGDAKKSVRQFICRIRVKQPGSVAMGSVYRIHHDKCGHQADSRSEQGAYRRWMDGFAAGVGRQPFIVFYEFDALITTGCLSRSGLAARIGELRYGIKKLSALPHTVVYIDAGAADALTYRRAASLLNKVGIGGIQGFFLNSTHYDWTSNEVKYGNRVSQLTHGEHFVVSTAVNGQGPLRPRSRVHGGNEVLCNPPGRGLGPRPTTTTLSSSADAYLWIGNPGRSGGKCHRGDATNGRFFLNYALGLVSRANEKLGPGYPSRPY